MAVLKKIQFIHASNGDYLGGTSGGARRLENVGNIYQLVSPADETANWLANSLVRSGDIVTDLMTLAKDTDGTQLYGRDVVDDTDPNYQDYVDWLVWEGEISDRSLQKISKFRSGDILVNFTTYEIVVDDTNLVADKGTFGSASSTTGGDLPSSGNTTGDYYTCDEPSYTSAEAGGVKYYYNEVSYWDGDSWEKASYVNLTQNTDQKSIGVGPGVQPNLNTIDEDDILTAQIVDTLNDHEGRITTNEDNIDDKMPLDLTELVTADDITDGDWFVLTSENTGLTKKKTALELRNYIRETVTDVVADYAELIATYPPGDAAANDNYEGDNVAVIDASGAPEVADRVDNQIWEFNISEGAWRNTQRAAQVTVDDFNALSNRVDNIEDGTTTVEKAKRDQNGDIIDDTYLNKVTSTPQTVAGHVTFQDGIVVEGTVTAVDTTNMEVQDNVIEVNKGETGAGVTLGKAGVQVDRGTLTDQQMVFDETDDKWKVGEIGSLVAVETVDNKSDDLSVNPTSTDEYLSKQGLTTKFTEVEGLISDNSDAIDDRELLANKRTTVRDIPEATDTNYVSEQGIRTELNKKQDIQNTTANTGIISMNQLSCTANQSDNTAVDVTSGKVRFIDNTDPENPTDVTLEYAGGTYSIPNIANDFLSWIYAFNNNGTVEISSQTTQPNGEALRDFVFLAEVLHPNGVVVNVSEVGVQAGAQETLGLVDYIQAGPIYNNLAGNDYSGVTSTMEMQRTTGLCIGPSINRLNNVKNPNQVVTNSLNPVEFTIIYRDGTGSMVFDNNNGNFYSSWDDIEFGGTFPIGELYDDGSGTLARIALANNATVHRILMAPQVSESEAPNTFVLIGQDVYTNITDANSAVDDNNVAYDDVDGRVFSNTIDRYYLSLRRDGADTTNVADARFKEIAGTTVASQGGVTTSLDDVNINNTSPVAEVQARGTNQQDLNESFDEDIRDLESTTIEFTSSAVIDSTKDVIVPIDGGSPEFTQIDGLTVTQQVSNGDFDDGTTNWTAIQATLSESGGILSVTGDGSGTTPQNRQTLNTLKQNDKIYLQARVRVTNANCDSLDLRYSDGVVAYTADFETTPTENEWYILKGIITITSATPTTGRIEIRHEYADSATASGKIMEVDYAIAIPLDNTPLASESESDLASRFPSYLSYGFNDAMPEIKLTGKNLFDKDDVIIGERFVTPGGSTTTDATSFRCDGYISVQESTDYAISFVETGIIRVIQYDSEFNVISSYTNSGTSGQFTTVSGTRYVRFSMALGTDNVNLEQGQLEEGTTATDYAEYYSPTARKFNAYPRSAGTVQDYLKQQNDLWIKEVNTERDFNDVVQSTTTWGIFDRGDGYHTFSKDLTSSLNYAYSTSAPDANLIIGDDIYNTVTVVEIVDTANDGYLMTISDTGTLRILVPDAVATDSAGFEAYLQANDVDFRYELDDDSKTTEEVDVDGSTYQESVTTMEQLTDYGFDYDIDFSSGVSGQVKINTKSIDKLRNETTLLEVQVDKFNGVVLYDEQVNISTSGSSASGTRITMDDSQNYLDYDYLIIEGEEAVVGVVQSTFRATIIPNGLIDIPVVWESEAQIDVITKSFHMKFNTGGLYIDTYYARTRTNYGTASNDANLYINSIKGFNN